MCKESSRLQVLDELRQEQESLLSFGDALDNKLNMLIGSGTLVLGLFAALGLMEEATFSYWLVIIISATGYWVSLFVLGLNFRPTTYHFPVKAEWDHLHKAYIPLEGDELLDKLISQNIEAIECNKEINQSKARAVTFGIWALLIIVVILSGCRVLLAI
jgi:hypothetical protein